MEYDRLSVYSLFRIMTKVQANKCLPLVQEAHKNNICLQLIFIEVKCFIPVGLCQTLYC